MKQILKNMIRTVNIQSGAPAQARGSRSLLKSAATQMMIGVAVTALAGLAAITHAAPATVLSTNAESALEEIGGALESGVTNLAVEPFGIYSLNAPGGHTHLGGGLGVFYNLNNYVAPGAGLVYLGHLSVFSGSVTVRLPFQPLPTMLPDLWVVPNVLGGLETATGGAGGDNGTVGALAGGGVSVSYGHLWGGQFNAGIELVNRTAAGGYSGWAGEPFVGWSKAF